MDIITVFGFAFLLLMVVGIILSLRQQWKYSKHAKAIAAVVALGIVFAFFRQGSGIDFIWLFSGILAGMASYMDYRLAVRKEEIDEDQGKTDG